MEKNGVDDYEIIDLDELIEKAIKNKKVNDLIVEKILHMNQENISTFNEFLEKKVVDFDVKNEDDLELPVDHFNNELSIKSKNISDYIEQNPLTNFESDNLLLAKGNRKINEDILKERTLNVKDKDKRKKAVQKIKFLLLLTGILIAVTLLVLSCFASNIEAFIGKFSKKVVNAGKETESSYVKVISHFFIFLTGFIILTVLYFALKYCFKIFLSRNKNREIKAELFHLKNRAVNLNERLNKFKVNTEEIRAKNKMAERLVFIFLKVVYWLLIIFILLNAFEIKLTALLASAGVITLVITMAAQVILIDYFSGVVYFFENYYNIGEIVKINDVTGKIIFANIKRIGIESFTGEQHFILHSQIKHIVNYSKSANKVLVTVDINYQNDIRKCLALLQNALNEIWTENSLIKAAPIVNGVAQFNGSNVKIEIEMPVEKETQWKVEKWIKLNVIEILKKNEIKTC